MALALATPKAPAPPTSMALALAKASHSAPTPREMRSPTAPAPPTPMALARSRSRRSLAIAGIVNGVIVASDLALAGIFVPHPRGLCAEAPRQGQAPTCEPAASSTISRGLRRVFCLFVFSRILGLASRFFLRLRHRSMQQRVLEQSLLNEVTS